MRIVVFQHLVCEHPGIWRDFMREDGIEIVTVELDAGDPWPFGVVEAVWSVVALRHWWRVRLSND
jgi:hypothetical protein